jgi:hypothetical protein
MTEGRSERIWSFIFFAFLAIVIFLAGFVAAKAEHTSFYLVNRSPVKVTHVYATSVVNQRFGQDLLGNGVLLSGQRKRVHPYDNRGCLFDVAIRFEGGHMVNRRGLDLCTITELSTTGQGVGVPNRYERPDTYREFRGGGHGI